MIDSLFFVLEQLGVALAFAGSVIYIAYYFVSIRDGIIDEKERQIMRIAKIVLRIGMAFILLTMMIGILRNFFLGNTPFFNDLFWFLALLLLIIVGNIALTAVHKEPNWLSSFIQAASWYAYFLVYILRPAAPFTVLLIYYLIWMLVCLYVFVVLRSRLLKKATR